MRNMKLSTRTYNFWLILLFACLQMSAKAQTTNYLLAIKDVAYAGGLTDWQGLPVDSLRCDIYYPPGATADKKYPMILSLHAGSFTGGSKEGQISGADALTDLGFVVVAPDYRTGYNSNTKDSCADDTLGLNLATYRATQDGNACMRFLYNYADSFHIDTSNFFLMGNSAGADLALHMQYVTDAVVRLKEGYAYNQLGSVQGTGNSFPFKYTVKGLCAMWGGLPNWNLINPKTAVPMILFKGGQDPGLPSDAPPYRGVGYYKKCPNYADLIAGIGIYQVMQAQNIPCVYHYQPNGFHAAYDEEFCTKATNSFFRSIMQTQPYSGYYVYYQQSW